MCSPFKKNCCTGNRSEYLENSRQKYFFNEPGIPSFRLMENEDDCGNTIEEPELYRPLGMDDYSYNKQIEVFVYSFLNATYVI